MATIVLGGVGAVIGFYAGGGPAGALKGFQIGATVGAMVDASHRPGVHQEVGRLADLRVSGSSYGTIIPQVWGATRVPGNVIWSTDLQEHSHTQHTGGKGGGGAASTTYTYSVSCAVAVCRGGRNVRVTRIWADDLILWDSGQPNTSLNWRWYPGTETQVQDTLLQAAATKVPEQGQTSAYRGMAYVVFENLPLAQFSNHTPNFSFEVTTDPVALGDVFGDVAAQVGLGAADLDVSQATRAVDGYQLGARAAAKDALTQLLTVFLFDSVEADGVLRLVARGAAAVAAIGPDEIGAAVEGGTGGNDFPGVETKRQQDVELPALVEISYFSAAKFFEQLTQRAIKQTAAVQNIVTLATSLTMTDDAARQAAETHLYNTWLERAGYEVAVLPKFSALTPGDVVQIGVGDSGQAVRMRVVGLDLGLPGEVRLQCVLDDAAPLSQFASGGAATRPTPPPLVGVAVPTTFYAWSGAELRAQDQSSAGFYVAGFGGAGWIGGGQVLWSSDGGASWLDGGMLSQPSVLGTCGAALADWAQGAGVQDTADTLTVMVRGGGPLASTTDGAAQAGDNPAVVGREIVAFATATLTGAGQYGLSRLWRGLRGSPSTGHAAGEAFVLAGPGVVRVNVPANLVGQPVQVKVVSAYQSPADVQPQTVTIAPRTLTAVEVQGNANTTAITTTNSEVVAARTRTTRAMSYTSLEGRLDSMEAGVLPTPAPEGAVPRYSVSAQGFVADSTLLLPSATDGSGVYYTLSLPNKGGFGVKYATGLAFTILQCWNNDHIYIGPYSGPDNTQSGCVTHFRVGRGNGQGDGHALIIDGTQPVPTWVDDFDHTVNSIQGAHKAPDGTLGATGTSGGGDTVKSGLVTALATAKPITPYYRITGYPNSRRSSGDTLDDSYFDGGINVPSGTAQTKWTHYANGPGGSLWLTGFEAWALRCKLGLRNTSSVAVSISIAAPIVDDYLKLTWAGATIYETQSTTGVPATASPATLTLAAGQASTLTLYYYNHQGSNNGTDNTNPMALRVLHDALLTAGVVFVDAGA